MSFMARVTALPCCTRRRFWYRPRAVLCSCRPRKTLMESPESVTALPCCTRRCCLVSDTRRPCCFRPKTSSKRARKASQFSRVARAAADFVLDTCSSRLRNKSSKDPACQQASCDSFGTRLLFFFFHSPSCSHQRKRIET